MRIIRKKLQKRRMEACVTSKVKANIDNLMEELQIMQEELKITRILQTNVTSQMMEEQVGLKRDFHKIMQVTIYQIHTRV